MVQDDTKQVQGDKQKDTGYHSMALVGTIDLYLLIRVSQVRDLHGLLASEGPPILGSFERIRVSRRWANRHPDFIVSKLEFQVITDCILDIHQNTRTLHIFTTEQYREVQLLVRTSALMEK